MLVNANPLQFVAWIATRLKSAARNDGAHPRHACVGRHPVLTVRSAIFLKQMCATIYVDQLAGGMCGVVQKINGKMDVTQLSVAL